MIGKLKKGFCILTKQEAVFAYLSPCFFNSNTSSGRIVPSGKDNQKKALAYKKLIFLRYERTYGQKFGNIKKCIEVIKPVYCKYDGERVPTYPSDEQFGPYGYCCNINDYWLKEKIDFWLKNGLQHFTAPKKKL